MLYKEKALSEITLRRYERPLNIEGRNLIKKLCLSLGLLNPGDSRDIIVDILYVFITHRSYIDSEKIREEVIKLRQSHGLELKGVAPSNIRRQLRRLRELTIIEKSQNKYRLAEGLNLEGIFDRIKRIILAPIIERIEEYAKEIDKRFGLQEKPQNDQ